MLAVSERVKNEIVLRLSVYVTMKATTMVNDNPYSLIPYITIRYRIYSLLMLFFITACHHEEMPLPGASLQIEYRLFSTTDSLHRSGWGYEITVEQQLFIKQSIIPAIGGIRVFHAQEDAAKVAQLVITKIRQNPNKLPAVSVKELVQLQVIDLSGLYVEPYQRATGGWGFNIMLDQLPVVSYDSFPGFQQGLPQKDDAHTVGQYIITNMQQFKNYMIDERVLKQLGIK
jgi:hypothetical protein